MTELSITVDPDPPKNNQEVSVTISGGVEPYVVGWQIEGGSTNRETGSFDTDIPDGSTGKAFSVTVKDANNDTKAYVKDIERG